MKVASAQHNPSRKALKRVPKQNNPSAKALKAVLKVNSIDLPIEIIGKYAECQKCPSDFWSWAGIRLDLRADGTKPIGNFLCEAYLGITHLQTQRKWDTIVWRFFVLFFHDLIDHLSRTNISSGFQDKLVLILSSSPSISDTNTYIQDNLKRWATAGLRYARLSKSLGNGALFLLPQTVTDKT